MLVRNQNADLRCNQFQGVVVNIKPVIRNEIMEGKTWMVAPMVMITEGVHAGSGGPLYYPKEELGKTPVVWNHKPIVIYHPTANGRAISACEPAVISKRKVGIIMNTEFVPGKKGAGGKLRAEAWLDPERLKEVDSRVYNAVVKGKMVEVSTGLFTDNEHKTGIWNGEDYESIARNYRPDHLAILPDQKGACSIEDGAGLLRNASLSHGEVAQQINDAVRAKLTPAQGMLCDAWVCDVYDTFAVYSYKGKSYRQPYTVTDGKIKLDGAPTEVTRRTTYATLDGEVINTGARPMKKKELVNNLIQSDQTSWDEDDRQYLNSLGRDKLLKMQPVDNVIGTIASGSDDNSEELKDPASQVKPKKSSSTKGQESQNAEEEDDEKDDEEDDEDDSSDESNGGKEKWYEKLKKNSRLVSNGGRALTVNEYIARAPRGIREVLNSGLRTLAAQRNASIDIILANERNRFTKAQLLEKPVEELEALADLATDDPEERRVMNYLGQGDVGRSITSNDDEEDGLPLPTINFRKRELVTSDADE